MSAETLEVVRGLQAGPDVDLAALWRDDAGSASLIEAIGSQFDERFECVAVTGVQPERRYSGLEGLRAAWLDWLEPWESYRTEPEDIIEVGDDDVLVLVRDYARRAGMNAEVSMDAAAVWTVRDGKVVRAAFYGSRQRALEAVGLRT